MKRAIACALTAACLSGCAVQPTDPSGRPLTVEDAGPPPANAEQTFTRLVSELLKDPDSAKVRNVSNPIPNVVKYVPGITTGGVGWSICGEVNAKNSYGGYTGYKWWWILVNQERLVKHLDPSMAPSVCAK